MSAKILSPSDGPSLPSLWVFLIIVLGILLGIVGITSGVMHLMQRNRRRSLRRRILAGDVNLEAIGIKRITVPKEVLDKMSLVTYHSSDIAKEGGTDSTVNNIQMKDGNESSQIATGDLDETTLVPPTLATASSATQNPATQLSFSQSTCAICLDDFVDGETAVRELPCRHVFHPECVDGFLQNTSSLCPMCKKSVLPVGFCPPQITNAMVRRERFHRNPSRRPRGMVETPADQMMNSVLRRHQLNRAWTRTPRVSAPASVVTNTRTRSRSNTLGGALTSIPRRISNAVSRRESSAPSPSTVEMNTVASVDTPASPPPVDPAETRRRRLSAANRLAEATAQGRTGEEEEMDRARRMPRCKLTLVDF
ncbi:MAG: hypothetical protein Q9160_005008 [Pyrenula sp. 1 TL-2023]